MCSCNGQYICYEVQLTVVLQLQLDCIYLQCVLQALYYKTGSFKYIAMYLNDQYA